PARDGWPPTSALALLVKMAAAPVVFRLLSHFAHARAARPASLREGMSLPRFDPAAKSCSLEPRPTPPSRPQLLSSPEDWLEDWCLICCLRPPCGCCRRAWRTIGSFGHQSEITREQLSLPLASPPSPSGIRGILWVVQSIDLWLYTDRHLAGLSARPPDRVELIGAGSLGYGTGPSFAFG
ncbi:hypothetical protein EMIHUDRAFT_372311, partial [Emiliania huxleyi CCMP1516]|uniref:Uncharacterized protein n=2 Tax=Emiliania huxleyi TaxID=2903 RepID=A0A0D3I4X0_EMIH1